MSIEIIVDNPIEDVEHPYYKIYELMGPDHPATEFIDDYLEVMGFTDAAHNAALNLGMDIGMKGIVTGNNEIGDYDVEFYFRLLEYLEFERDKPHIRPTVSEVIKMTPLDFLAISNTNYFQRLDYVIDHYYRIN